MRKLLKDSKELMFEYNYEKNSDIDLEKISIGSNKKVWWRCAKGHEWLTSVKEKTTCPYCSSRKILSGFNDLATVYPELAKEWNYTKNGRLKPSDVLAKSNKKVWWQCSKGHEWEVSIYSRAYNKSSCPCCSGKRVIKGETDLATLFPQLLKEWNYEKNMETNPNNVTAYSSAKVWWRCKNGHEWQAVISNRTRNHTGCPYCTGRQVIPGFNDLETDNSSLAREWNYEKNGKLLPSMVSVHSSKKVWWKCKYGHEWKATISDRSNNHGCPQCALFIPGVSDLLTDNPELAAQWDYEKNAPLTPDRVARRSTIRVWWIGTCGHQWNAQISERNRSTRKGSGCPICNKNSNTSVQEQTVFYYIKQVFPDAINSDRRYSLEFDIYIPSINTAIEYDGYMWHSKDYRDTTDERKNLLCIDKGIRLIRILEPGLPAFQNCICLQRQDMTDSCLETIIMQICDLLSEGKVKLQPNIARDRQRVLSMYETAAKENSLQALRPDIAVEWHPTKNGTLKPENLTVNSGQKAWWRCSKCGYEWEGSVHARTNINRKMNGCPVCAGTIVVPGLNDFASAYPELAKEWHPTKNGELTPEMITRGSHQKVWWLGKCGHEWQTHLHHRIAGSGCPYCSNRYALPGFNDLATTNPEIVAEWDPENKLSPSEVTAGSAETVSWICPKGHKYQSPVSRRKRSGCPYCAGQKVLVGFNDITTTRPDLAEIWNHEKNGELTPQSLTEHTNKKIWFVCKEGHEWVAVPNSMKNNSCPYCTGRKLLRGFNDLKTVRPDLVEEWDYIKNADITPENVTYKSSKKVCWKCNQCGNQWVAAICNRSVLNTGCPECGKRKISISRKQYWKNRKNNSFGSDEKEDYALAQNSSI